MQVGLVHFFLLFVLTANTRTHRDMFEQHSLPFQPKYLYYRYPHPQIPKKTYSHIATSY